MNLIITKWLLVYVLEHKHNFHVIHFLSLTVLVFTDTIMFFTFTLDGDEAAFKLGEFKGFGLFMWSKVTSVDGP